MTDEKPRVIIIPPKPELQQTAAVTKQLRVAAYCRVSTKEEEQASSYEAQCEYYTDKIMSNKEWTMAGIFADDLRFRNVSHVVKVEPSFPLLPQLPSIFF